MLPERRPFLKARLSKASFQDLRSRRWPPHKFRLLSTYLGSIPRAMDNSPSNCVICAANLSDSESDRHPPSRFCKHVNATCVLCFEQYVQSCLRGGNFMRLQCVECDSVLAYDDLLRLVPVELFMRSVFSVIIQHTVSDRSIDMTRCLLKRSVIPFPLLYTAFTSLADLDKTT